MSKRLELMLNLFVHVRLVFWQELLHTKFGSNIVPHSIAADSVIRKEEEKSLVFKSVV
jgi:hypothetical protein